MEVKTNYELAKAIKNNAQEIVICDPSLAAQVKIFKKSPSRSGMNISGCPSGIKILYHNYRIKIEGSESKGQIVLTRV